MSGVLYDVTGKLLLSNKTAEWCKLPYPDHPDGCPNYGVKEGCPPKAPLIHQFADMSKPMYFMVTTFNLAGHVERMRAIYPGWSDRQARCCLYWQRGVRKELEAESRRAILKGYGAAFNLCPEAMGVNVIRTLKALHVPVETKPKTWVYKVALLCYPNLEQFFMDFGSDSH